MKFQNGCSYELRHHGIKGQKWGELNGPPYPLGANDHSSKEKKEGTKGWTKEAKKDIKSKKYSKSEQDETEKKKNGLTDKQKTALKVVAGVAAVSAVAFISYKAYNNPEIRARVNDLIEQNGAKKASKLTEQTLLNNGIKKISNVGKDGKESIQDTTYWANKNARGLTFGRNHNCVSCSFASELRRRGFDVSAKEQTSNYNLSDVMKVYGKPERFRGETAKELEKSLLEQGEGSRGIIMGNYYDKVFGSHFFNYEVKDGKISFFDGQRNENNVFSDIFPDKEDLDGYNTAKTMFIRTDNKEPNIDALLNYVESNDGGHYNFTDKLVDKWIETGKFPKSAISKTLDNGHGALKRSYMYVKGS